MTGVRVARAEPPGGMAAGRYKDAALLDSYAVILPKGTDVDARRVAELTLGDQPAVVRALMGLRDGIMARLGVLTSRQMREASDGLAKIDFFPITAESASEIELGMKDRHLDFQVWFTLDDVEQGLRARSTTVVRTHNLLGRAYIAVIRPFHAAIVRAALRRAAIRVSRPPRPSTPTAP